jgi:hypothetical protein
MIQIQLVKISQKFLCEANACINMSGKPQEMMSIL